MYCECKFFSKALNSQADITVIVPSVAEIEGYKTYYNKLYSDHKPFKVLYLLHGAQMNHSSWTRNTSVERYAQDKNIVIVMPSGENGFFVNMKHGLDYFDYLTEDRKSVV